MSGLITVLIIGGGVYLLLSILRLKDRVATLEQRVAELAWRGLPAAPESTSEPVRPSEMVAQAPQTPTAEVPLADMAWGSIAQPAAEPVTAMPPPLPPLGARAAASAAANRDGGEIPVAAALARPNPLDVALRTAKRWITTGNVPVKVGMLVLLAGVAALLKYASDQGWLRLPIEFRLIGISLAAMAGLVFGWRQRISKPDFALAVQGGCIGVLLLVIFAATRLYPLLPPALAFGLSVVLVAAMCVLAVLQDSRTLAVLAVLAGFMAPIWLSDGSGNHVALFSYYAMLNLGIIAVAWRKPWRILVLLGFVFTWGIGIAWGVLKYRPEFQATTQPFLWLFFAIYLLIPILFARQRPVRMRDRIDACLLFGTPLIAFSLQSALMPHQPMTLAAFAIGLAALYAGLSWWLRQRGERYAVISEAHALLAIAFATLAVPLALSARVTAAVFALEGAGMVWLALRQQRRLPLVTGLALQLAAAVAFVVRGAPFEPTLMPILNADFMSMLLIAVGSLASALALHRAQRSPWSALLYVWGLVWWLLAISNDIERLAQHALRPDFWLMAVAVTAWLAAEACRQWGARALALTVVVALALALPLAFWQAELHAQPFAGFGGIAWAVFAVAGVRSLICLRATQSPIAGGAQFAWWLAWPTVLSLLASYIAERADLAQGWHVAGVALPWLALAAITLLRWNWLTRPLDARFDALGLPFRATLFAVLAAGWMLSLFAEGGAAPLPWIPLLNPLELVQLAALLLLLFWLRSADFPARFASSRGPLIGALLLAWISFVTLRATHFWGGEPWSPTMFSHSLPQTAITIVWSVLGVAGWIIGSRRGLRTLWLAGALLMGVVLAKLVLVDRQHLGNLLGIGSFIGYGLLCTVVGYFAPAPPRGHQEEAAA